MHTCFSHSPVLVLCWCNYNPTSPLDNQLPYTLFTSRKCGGELCTDDTRGLYDVALQRVGTKGGGFNTPFLLRFHNGQEMNSSVQKQSASADSLPLNFVTLWV